MLLLPDAKNCAVLPKQLAQVHRAEARTSLYRHRGQHRSNLHKCTEQKRSFLLARLRTTLKQLAQVHRAEEQVKQETATVSAKQLAQVHRAEAQSLKNNDDQGREATCTSAQSRRSCSKVGFSSTQGSNLHKCTEQKLETTDALGNTFVEATCTSAQSRSKIFLKTLLTWQEATCTSAQSRSMLYYFLDYFAVRSNLHKCAEQKGRRSLRRGQERKPEATCTSAQSRSL